jgi:hypothetical protein
MRDTVELLEAIGRDATLRRASTEVLGRALEATNASPGLLELVSHGDSTTLTIELGIGIGERFGEHHSQTAHMEDSLLN